MDEKILRLYRELSFATTSNMDYHKRKKMEHITSMLPKIQEFSTWFLEENRFGIESSFYQDLCINLNQILQDIVLSFDRRDYVLLHDALAYGFLDYLRMFVMEENETNDDL